MIDEGTIKYRCEWQQKSVITPEDIAELNHWRSQLYQLGLIGAYDNGIGFGNISIRLGNTEQFIISGTQTGGIANLTASHYTKVNEFDWCANYVVCEGEIKASSETMTHAAIYTASQANAVVHVHHQQLWERSLDRLPTTDINCAYGTPEMAEEIIRLCQKPQTQQQKIIIMSGHESGILTFGRDLTEANQILLHYYSAI